MIEYQIIDTPQEISYFCCDDPDTNRAERYYNQCNTFSDSGERFLKQLKKHADVRKQAGFSKSRNCHFISFILVTHNSGDGEFIGHSIKNTCLIDEFDIIRDSNNYSDEYGEVGYSIRHAYHQLPDGKILEFTINNAYQDELEEIYYTTQKLRNYYDLSNKLEDNNVVQKRNKI